MTSTTERVLPATGQRGIRGRPWRDYLLFVALAGPNLLLLALFTYRPLLDNFRLSLFDWNLASPDLVFVGLDNYREWFTRGDSWTIVQNTVLFTVFAVGGCMVLGLALALLLDQQLKGRNLVRGAIFAPFVVSGAAIGIAFQFVFDPSFGLVQDLIRRANVLLGQVGIPAIPAPDFYQEPRWALVMITVTFIWKYLGFSFVIYLAALQGVRQDLLEAAEIDGASRWTTFWRVLMPQLRPTTYFLSITVLLSTLQVFDIIYVMTRGGPLGNGTTTMIFQVYQESFVNFRAGYGATVATLLFLALLIVTVVQVRMMDQGEAR